MWSTRGCQDCRDMLKLAECKYCNKLSANWPAIRLEGNRRDYNMLGNQTSGKEGGVRCVMMFICMYVCVCVCMLDIVYV